MSTVRLIHNAIIAGRWYGEGEPIEESIVPPNLRKYIAKPASKSSSQERQLSYQLNQPYSLDEEGYLRGKVVARQAAQMEAESSQDEMLADELAEGEVSETVAAAMEVAREDLQAEVERERVQARVKAEEADAAEEFLRQEQDAQAQNGEYDQFDSVPDELTPVNPESAKDWHPRATAAARGSATRKPDLKAKKKSYVRRGSKFLPASTVELIEGERLYWHRKTFGVAEKWIPFSTVNRKES